MRGVTWVTVPLSTATKHIKQRPFLSSRSREGQPQPHASACSCSLCPLWRRIFLTMERAAKTTKLCIFSRLGKHPELLPPFHPITNRWKQLFPFWFLLLFSTILINCFWKRQNKRKKILYSTPHS